VVALGADPAAAVAEIATCVLAWSDACDTAGAVITLRPARRRNQLPVWPAVAAAHEAERGAHFPQRIRVEYGISHLKSWRALSRRLGRSEHLDPSAPLGDKAVGTPTDLLVERARMPRVRPAVAGPATRRRRGSSTGSR
jgi:hypothetical protein